MSGNSIGKLFQVTTWGESHGPALGAVIDGCPSGIDLAEADIQKELNRRRPGQIASATARREQDLVEILSGTFAGKTTGTPISLLIRNTDARSHDYEAIKDLFRPGHGDFTFYKKYGIRDYRGGGRASSRETAARVAAGAVAAKVIARVGMEVMAYTRSLGGVTIKQTWQDLLSLDREELGNKLFCPDPEAMSEMETRLAKAKQDGDSLGGIVEILVRGCPAGLGEPVFDKMDADLAKALMGIGSIKGVEIGAGFEVAAMTGAFSNDPITPAGFLSNHAGGILAGITSGQPLVIRVASKPIPSIGKVQQTVDLSGQARELRILGRHDVATIPRIVPVCEAMVNIILADHLLKTAGNNGMKDIQIGIIGGTRGMGKWFADFLRQQGYQVHVAGSKTGMSAAAMAACCQVVVVSVPIGLTTAIIAKVGPLLGKENLIMDLTSLKVEPVKAMLNYSEAEVIGCHPLFGPQVERLENRHVVLCPARGKTWLPWLREVLTRGGAAVEVITPAKHDELMSIVQGLNHLNTIAMGMALSKTAAPLSQLDSYTTPSFDTKSKMVRNIFSDNPRLYAEIICKNNDMTQVIAIYEQVLADIKGCVLQGKADSLTAAMEKAAARLWPG